MILLCSRGRELHDRWTGLLEKHAEPEEIYSAMQDYFFHKNGVLSKNGVPTIAPCGECRLIAGARVEHFVR